MAWFTWDVVFKLATLVILIFSGVSVDQLNRTVRQVEIQTGTTRETTAHIREQHRAMERAIAETQEQVMENSATLTTQVEISATNRELMRHIAPLFQDIVQRQRQILNDIAGTQAVNEQHAAQMAALQAQLKDLLTLHEHLIEQQQGPRQ